MSTRAAYSRRLSAMSMAAVRPSGSASKAMVTECSSNSWLQSGSHPLVPGMAMAGSPRERPAIASGSPSTSSSC
jgi:hypothetical protein